MKDNSSLVNSCKNIHKLYDDPMYDIECECFIGDLYDWYID